VNEFNIHLKKDIKLLTSDSMFIIFLVMMAVASFIIALTTCAGYVQQNSYGTSVVTKASLEAAQTTTLVSYWSVVGGLLTAMLMGASAMAMGAEKESGMTKYTLSHRVRGPAFYLSKLVVILGMIAIAMLTALAAYVIVFSFMDVPMLDLGSLALSMVFPFLAIVVFSSLGLAISTLGTKKGATVAVAIVVFIVLSVLSSISINMGAAAAIRADPSLTYQNYTEALPLEYKLLIYGNPMVITYGSEYVLGMSSSSAQLYDPAGGVLLAAGFFVAFTALGLVLMSRERMEWPWSERAKALVKRIRGAA
jgi:ABC-type transport system involved in multi-copper enzyme maturation permease subunit